MQRYRVVMAVPRTFEVEATTSDAAVSAAYNAAQSERLKQHGHNDDSVPYVLSCQQLEGEAK